MNNPERKPIVSFCTTVANRLPFMQHSLWSNLESQPQDWVEFVVLDYGSTDGLGAWLRDRYWPWIEQGRVSYYRVDNTGHFVHAHAKNLAHLLSRGEYICNLDAECRINAGFADLLREHYTAWPDGFSRMIAGGGTIALTRSNFIKVGGYDESMIYGWGYEDNDFGDRLFRALPHNAGVPDTLLVVEPHPDSLRTERTRLTSPFQSSWIHKRISDNNTVRGRVKANQGRRWGYWPEVTHNFVKVIPGDVFAVDPDATATSIWP